MSENYQGALSDLNELLRVAIHNREGLDDFIKMNYPDKYSSSGIKSQKSVKNTEILPSGNVSNILQKLDAVERTLNECAFTCDSDAVGYIPEIRAALERIQWMPIESAPKDGTKVDVWISHDVNERFSDAYFDKQENLWCWDIEESGKRITFNATPPAYWMPLPTPPKGGSDGNA